MIGGVVGGLADTSAWTRLGAALVLIDAARRESSAALCRPYAYISYQLCILLTVPQHTSKRSGSRPSPETTGGSARRAMSMNSPRQRKRSFPSSETHAVPERTRNVPCVGGRSGPPPGAIRDEGRCRTGCMRPCARRPGTEVSFQRCSCDLLLPLVNHPPLPARARPGWIPCRWTGRCS